MSNTRVVPCVSPVQGLFPLWSRPDPRRPGPSPLRAARPGACRGHSPWACDVAHLSIAATVSSWPAAATSWASRLPAWPTASYL